jgi:indole-3-glycerol phosphate synthase
VLDAIIEKKIGRLAVLKKEKPQGRLQSEAASAPAVRDFRAAISRKGGISLIAEIKKASPSKGIIRERFDPAAIARAYEKAGASALSVITEEDFFLGSPESIRAARESSRLPVLRKDFIFDTLQIYESRALGADAVLLIAAVLNNGSLAALFHLAGELGMAALVEVHSANELERALLCGAGIIGINSRDLKTMQIDPDAVERIIKLISDDKIVIAESGIRTAADMRRLHALGADAALVGEALMRCDDVESAVRALLGEPR